ncbi:L-2-amino-thiazoline-4-carboxylic acid hydrolase [Leptolinea tardivitalis]|uniref:L-2-amino-thiazoline-4-carboxylic acid hydrolase n=1 Tax=Leptolinea tardivitalis TaxID=229920 RepID=A0A0P6XDU5_9CHLR|nr:L-2-amino-thiazoline-4-carboxylic acid hydrolase [Leptolinea tardivitalis]KPL73332.1 hypothetical protein ADM99_03710 [Leptolinea tardivitalis]GAP21467.1 L-2-amino-thiazoline-4-carboxylic acid hydrolase [Leptolinea tardivitalis]
MHNDPIEENLPWITPWFTKADPVGLKLNEYEKAILAKMAAGWHSTNKIALFDSLGESFGRKLVGNVMDKIVAANIRPEWEAVGKAQPANTIDDLIRLLWEPLPSQGFELSVEKTSSGVQIHCTHCPHADLGKSINGSEWLYHLVCSGDPHAAAGFNPAIGFKRTQTLMEGYPCCNHFYYLKENSNDQGKSH